MCTPICLENRHVTVIGGGVIGASWIALFLVHRMHVTLSDPQADIKEHIFAYLQKEAASLQGLGYDISPLTGALRDTYLHFETDLARAVQQADYIQENGPERLEIKQNIWKTVEEHAPTEAIFLSSSSGIPASRQAQDLQHADRLLIGHPFNPPHLMPLVEVVAGEKTSESSVQKAMVFYSSLGKIPLRIKKEISSFVANRLQCALFRECVALVRDNVISAADLDHVVMTSLGIRWAVNGPFLSFHLGGGEGGFEHFLDHLAPGMAQRWAEQQAHQVNFDEETRKILLEQIQKSYGQTSMEILEHQRDQQEVALINLLHPRKE